MGVREVFGNIGLKIKDAYFGAEEKYYGFLDKVNEKIPVYKIIDPLDRVIPSFALLLGIILFLILLGVYYVAFPLVTPKTTTLIIEVLDEEESPLPGIALEITVAGQKITEYTDDFGETQFEVPENTLLGLRIEEEGYEIIEKDVIAVQPRQTETITLVEIKKTELTKTIALKDFRGQPVKDALVSFACSNPEAIAPENAMTDYRGIVSVIAPSNCGLLTFSAQAEGLIALDSVPVTEDYVPISFEPDEEALGRINVNVLFEGDPVDNIKVKLYYYFEQELGPIDEDYSSNGIVIFDDVPPADYIIKTEASQGYSEAESDEFTLGANQTKTVTINLERKVIGQVNVRVIDDKTKRAVEKAKVKLQRQGKELAESITNASGLVSFDISEDVDYEIVIDHEDYLVKFYSGIRRSAVPVDLEITKYIPGVNGGELRVAVVDDEGNKVQNAKVALYNEATKELMPYEEQTTDLNGEVVFTRVENGTYKAFAFKRSASGWSDAAYFEVRRAEEVKLTVVMQIPEGTVEVTVIDEESEPVQFARVAVYDPYNRELLGSDFTDAEGKYSVNVKSDRDVYLKVSKEKYVFYSIQKPVFPNTVTEFTAIIQKRLKPGPIEVVFKGLYQGDALASNVSPGQQYTARFHLKVPEVNEYEEMGFHVRVGDADITEKDPLFIKGTNGEIAKVFRGTTFTLDYEVDSQSLTYDAAKWVNFTWFEITPGIYEVEVTIEIKSSATLDDRLNIYYKAYGIEEGRIDRDPVDESPGPYALYDNVKQETYQVGITTLCDDEFCFDAQIYDKKEKLLTSVSGDYTAKVYGDYNLKFNLVNNSETKVHNNAFIRIKNPEKNIWFKTYELFNSETGSVTGNLQGYAFPDYDVGNFTPKKRMSADLDFETQTAGTGVINVQLISDFVKVFEKNITIISAATENMDVSVTPAELASGIENKIKVLVNDSRTKLEIENATVTVLDRFKIMLAQGFTSRLGEVELELPAQNPGEDLMLRVEKTGYNTVEQPLKVKAEILELKPEQIGLSLNVKTKLDDTRILKAKNIASFPFKVESIEALGNFKGFVNQEEMNNFLAQYNGMVFQPQDEKEIFVKAMLTEEGKAIAQRASLEGRLKLIVTNFGMLWSFDLPLKIEIGLGAEVEDPNCLVATKSEWKMSSEGQPIKTEFELQNGCVVEGKPVALRDLSVKLNPISNTTGDYTVEILEDGVMRAKATVRTGYYLKILSLMSPEKRYQIILTFTPHGGVFALEKGELSFKAINPIETGDQVISTSLKTEIGVTNYQECISFSKDYIKLDEEGQGSFYVETKNCGGITDFEIRSKLRTSIKEFKLEASEKSPEIEVYAEKNFQGLYPVYVDIKPQHAKTLREAKMIRVMIPKKPEECLELSRYEFDVYDNPDDPYDGYDTTELINACYDKKVTIKVSQKDWSKALKTGLIWGVAAGFLTSWASPEAKEAAKGPVSKLTEASKLATELEKVNAALEKATGVQKQILEQRKKELTEKLKELGFEPEEKPLEKKEEPEKKPLEKKCEEKIENGVQVCIDAEGKAHPPECEGNNEIPYECAEDRKTCTYGQVKPCGKDEECEAGKGCVAQKYFCCVYEEDLCTTIYRSVEEATPENIGLSRKYCEDRGGTFLEGRCRADCKTTTQAPTAEKMGLITGFDVQAPGLLSFVPTLMSSFMQKVLGTNPIVNGLIIGGAVALHEYSKQKDKVNIETILRDLELTIDETSPVLLQETGKEEAIATEVSVEAGSSSMQPRLGKPGLHQEILPLTFTREEDFNGSIFRILMVKGIQHNWNTKKTYKKGKGVEELLPAQPPGLKRGLKVDELAGLETKQKFHLMFNSIPPEERIIAPLVMKDCELLGGGTGATGPEALPRVLLNWEWGSEADFDACDEGNEDYVYCDATQFSIEVLKKINKLKNFLADNPNLACPTAEKALSTRTNIISEDNIGISYLAVEKKGKDVNIVVEILNNNQQAPKVDLTVTIAKEGFSDTCTISNLRPLTKERHGCEFEDLSEGTYTITAELAIDLTVCDVCYNNNTADDKVESYFTIGVTGLEQCEPYTTTRLLDFIEATEEKGESVDYSEVGDKAALAELIDFRAYLIQDQYSQDFQADFDDTYRVKRFLAAPSYYTEPKGLGDYFKNPELFRFKGKYVEVEPTGLLVRPGLYSVDINITFDNENWQFWEDEQADAVINIELERNVGPVPDYPFYYMPFDGLVGMDNERINYGLNYEGDPINVNEATEQLIRTLNIPGSNPVQTLSTTFLDRFKNINVWNRGEILRVSRGEKINLTFSPSYATPVILNVHNTGVEAWGFYSVAINNSTVQSNVGPEMLLWTGIGITCMDFMGRSMTDVYDESADIHALDTEVVRCARVEPPKEIAYGLEWCANLVKTGDVWLKTIVFTPQGVPSSMQIESGSDTAGLIGFEERAETPQASIDLYGVPLEVILEDTSQTYNYYGRKDIKAIEEVFNLVKARKVCVSGTGLSTAFVWNPKPIYEQINTQETHARENCIVE